MDYRADLNALVKGYCQATGLSEARVANLAGCDGQFFARLRGGKSCTVDTLNRLRAWFSGKWPADADWPEGIDRIAPVEVSADAA